MRTTILNVDDHEVNRYIRTQMLQKAGYQVVEAATGEEAIRCCSSQKPALVLLDINLPDMNGMEVCQRIKASSSKSALVIHVSATYVDSSDQVRGLHSGADGYLCEPVDPELLIATVNSFLRLRDAEIRLQDSQERLTQAQTIAGLTFWEWDIERNRVLQSGEGPAMQEIPFPEWLSLVHIEDRAGVEEMLRRACENMQPFHHEYRVYRPDETVRWLATKGRVFYDDNRNPVRIMGTDMEITDRKRIELAVKRSNENLSQFAFMISHDLQEPLRSITAFTELLSARYAQALDQEATTYMQFVIEGSRRMNAMIRELLAFCQIETTELRQVQPVELEAVLSGVLANITAAVEECGAVITHDPLPVVSGDASQLTEVFQNLLGNSLKYRKPDEPLRVHISSQRGKSEWVVSVTDNGIGFDQKDAEKIFGMFKRLHGSDVPGSGIGLAIVKKIVERHGGRVWAESQPGAGSRFRFALPL